MPEDDVSYYQARAEQEIALAQQASDTRVARAHFILAGHYLDLVHSSAAAPPKPPPPVWL